MPRRLFPWLLLLAALPLHAHTLSVAHLDITRMDGGEAQIELDLAIRDLALSFPLDTNHDERVTWGELQAVQQPLEQWVVSGLSLSTDAGACALHPRGLATRRYDDGAYATLQMVAHCPSRSSVRVRYGLLFAVDPQHRALITLREGTTVRSATGRANAREVILGAAPSHPFADFLREGFHHIAIGYDHLAFLLSLLLPAALLRQRGEWLPAEDLRRVVMQVLGIVTAFTLAHSLTLSLAALDWVTPASRWVEPAIAGSVLLAAANNIHPLVTRRAWAVGFGFGLIHGFGFAVALGELGLPPDTRLLALLGFNLGVELGQLAVVSTVLPVLFLLRRQRWYAGIAMPLLSVGIGAAAMLWLWQRLAA